MPPQTPGRTRTRWLRYRGSGPTRSGDSEPPARELPPDPTLNPACPRTTTCGSYLARNPARVAPLRVGVARKDRFREVLPAHHRIFIQGGGRAAGHGARPSTTVLRPTLGAISTTHRRATTRPCNPSREVTQPASLRGALPSSRGELVYQPVRSSVVTYELAHRQTRRARRRGASASIGQVAPSIAPGCSSSTQSG